MIYVQNTQIWLKILTFDPPGDHRGVTLGSKKNQKKSKTSFLKQIQLQSSRPVDICLNNHPQSPSDYIHLYMLLFGQFIWTQVSEIWVVLYPLYSQGNIVDGE